MLPTVGVVFLLLFVAWIIDLWDERKYWQEQNGRANIRAEQAEDRVEKIERIGRRILSADERGQGLPWQEAMDELKRLLDP